MGHDGVRDLSLRFERDRKRINYVTPTSYLELIQSFQTSLGKVQGAVMKQKNRYSTGLEKLQFASEQVSTMQTELKGMLPGLEKAKEETAKLMNVIEEKLPG